MATMIIQDSPASMSSALLLLILLHLASTSPGCAFNVLSYGMTRVPKQSATTCLKLSSGKEEAERLLAKSRALREEIAQSESEKKQQKQGQQSVGLSSNNYSQQEQPSSTISTAEQSPSIGSISKWAVPLRQSPQEEEGVEYRLYVDIGRELGSWMEPRWGASGRRIEFTLDVRFVPNQLASAEAAARMVQDNRGGKRSPTFTVQTAPVARLRKGFDEMKCSNGAYRIDQSKKPGESDALRFYVMTEGTPETNDSTYGDVSIPSGGLYFSIPCFGASVTQISKKDEFPVTVRQMGWHTGWRREESRIVGIFKAWPIEAARKKDGF